jgi:hypothetical protein
MDWTSLSQAQRERLPVVLRAALGAPGNWERFRQAGLAVLTATGSDLALAADWQTSFQRLSPLAKRNIRQQPGQFLAKTADIVYRGTTSGSSDQAYTFFAGTLWNQRRVEARQRLLAMWGIDATTPVVAIASRLMPGQMGDEAIVGAVTPALVDWVETTLANRQTVVRGYPSRLCEVASAVRSPLSSVIAVICTGEPLFQQQRVLLEQIFQAPVVNEYGCHEAAVLGMSCPEVGRIHLDETRCCHEIWQGNLVTTDLWNEVMPLIRYQCGDRVRPYDTPCPCGRPGLTVEVLGRLEDSVNTRRGVSCLGKVPMPSLPGIRHYRVQRQTPTQIDVWAHLAPGTSKEQATEVLQAWAQATLGAKIANLTAAPPLPISQSSTPVWSNRQWLETITQKSLADWLTTDTMPAGEALTTAQLLRSLLCPSVVGVSLPCCIQAAIAQFAQAPAASDAALSLLQQRVLLLAASCLGDRDKAVPLFTQVMARWQNPPQSLPPALHLEGLIASLYLPRSLTLPLWETWDPQAILTLDPLHVQHLLAAFEAGLTQRSAPTRTALARSLHPVQSVLVGDLSFWAQELTGAHVDHWYALLWGEPLNPAESLASLSPFLVAWLHWRDRLLQAPQTAAPAWSTLLSVAQSPDQIARAWLEHGYHQLTLGHRLVPEEWVPRLTDNGVDLLTAEVTGLPGLAPWLPVLRSLADSLHRQGQSDLAYRCLTAVSVPTRQGSAFERRTTAYNQKQVVLQDFTPWQGEVQD